MEKERRRRSSTYKIKAITRCKNLEDKISFLEKRLDEGICNNKLRNVNISKSYLKRFLPYFLASSITISSFSFMGIVPFHKDDKESFVVYENSIYGNGKSTSVEEDYVSYLNYNSRIEYYSKWEECNGFYKRSIFSYESENPIFDLERCLNDEEFFEEIMRNSLLVRTIVCDDVSCLDDAYLKAVLYSFDRDRVVIRKETSWEDFFSSLKEILLVSGFCALIGFRRKFKGISYADEINEIREKYPYVDIELIKDDLDKCREVYKRLVKY